MACALEVRSGTRRTLFSNAKVQCMSLAVFVMRVLRFSASAARRCCVVGCDDAVCKAVACACVQYIRPTCSAGWLDRMDIDAAEPRGTSSVDAAESRGTSSVDKESSHSRAIGVILSEHCKH